MGLERWAWKLGQPLEESSLMVSLWGTRHSRLGSFILFSSSFSIVLVTPT